MSLINPSYFHGEIHISSTEDLAVQEDLQGLIDKYEPKLLLELLGKTMYREFIDAIDSGAPDQKWVNLRDGVQDEWMGFVNEEELSLIANYVYFWWCRKENTQTVGIGTVKVKAENAVKVTPVQKYVRAWNEMVDWICEMHEFIKDNIADYPDYEWKDYHSPCKKCYCSCCSSKKYPFSKINSLGL